MVIRALVYAHDEDEALDKAKAIFDDLYADGHLFDYYRTFDMDGRGIAGRDRWGELPVVVRADSPEGQRLIQEGMEFTRRELFENLDRVRRGLAVLTNDDIWNDVDKREEDRADFELCADMLRHFMYEVGQYVGYTIWLYDNDGTGIRTPGQLQDVLTKYRCLYEDVGRPNPYADMDIFIVPADVHH